MPEKSILDARLAEIDRRGVVGERVGGARFSDTEALRRFEGSLRALPEVREVVVREFEGEHRAIVDVHLAEPTP